MHQARLRNICQTTSQEETIAITKSDYHHWTQTLWLLTDIFASLVPSSFLQRGLSYEWLTIKWIHFLHLLLTVLLLFFIWLYFFIFLSPTASDTSAALPFACDGQQTWPFPWTFMQAFYHALQQECFLHVPPSEDLVWSQCMSLCYRFFSLRGAQANVNFFPTSNC